MPTNRLGTNFQQIRQHLIHCLIHLEQIIEDVLFGRRSLSHGHSDRPKENKKIAEPFNKSE
jgi:hypothetical protein